MKKNDVLSVSYFSESEPFDFCQKVRWPIGKGLLKASRFDSGLKLYSQNLKPNQNPENYIEVKNQMSPTFGLRFCISGMKIIKMNSFNKEVIIKSNQCSIFNFSEEQKEHKLVSDDNLQLLFIIIEQGPLHSLLCKELIKSGHGVVPPSENNYGEPFNLTNQITPEMYMCINQIYNCPYSGGAKSFYIESKIMELIAYNIDLLKSGYKNQVEKLKPSDIDRMYYAGELLVGDFQNPPKICEILKKTGTSRTKFFKEFREVHGASPVAYMRSARLQKAKEILENETMNIAEISNFLGFSHPGHFSRAFKKFYGFSPSLYNKKY